MPTSSSPVLTVSSRSIKDTTKILLWVRSGGRCEFDGCLEYLLEHPVTLDVVNLGETAHIVAFKPDGPRGDVPGRPVDINNVENLMMLCGKCHKLIDRPETKEKFSRSTLERHKREHEERIFHLTACKPDRKTSVVQFCAKVGGGVAAIPKADIWDAVAPLYPADTKGIVIDLTSLDDDSDAYYTVAKDTIARATDRLYLPGIGTEAPRHLSLFALAPMPLLMYLGSRLSNKTPLDVYQRHRDTQTWSWKPDGPAVRYTLQALQHGTERSHVALMLSLSAALDRRQLPPTIDETYTIYEISLAGETPSSLFLRRREDLEGFRAIYHETLSTISKNHGALEDLLIFPAVPAPVAVLCGYELFPKVSPRLLVYDNDRRRGGWVHALDVDRPH